MRSKISADYLYSPSYHPKLLLLFTTVPPPFLCQNNRANEPAKRCICFYSRKFICMRRFLHTSLMPSRVLYTFLWVSLFCPRAVMSVYFSVSHFVLIAVFPLLIFMFVFIALLRFLVSRVGRELDSVRSRRTGFLNKVYL